MSIVIQPTDCWVILIFSFIYDPYPSFQSFISIYRKLWKFLKNSMIFGDCFKAHYRVHSGDLFLERKDTFHKETENVSAPIISKNCHSTWKYIFFVIVEAISGNYVHIVTSPSIINRWTHFYFIKKVHKILVCFVNIHLKNITLAA